MRRLRLQPVNIQTNCQSRLRQSKQSDAVRKNTTLSESALLLQSDSFVTIRGEPVPFVTSKDAWFAGGVNNNGRVRVWCMTFSVE